MSHSTGFCSVYLFPFIAVECAAGNNCWQERSTRVASSTHHRLLLTALTAPVEREIRSRERCALWWECITSGVFSDTGAVKVHKQQNTHLGGKTLTFEAGILTVSLHKRVTVTFSVVNWWCFLQYPDCGCIYVPSYLRSDFHVADICTQHSTYITLTYNTNMLDHTQFLSFSPAQTPAPQSPNHLPFPFLDCRQKNRCKQGKRSVLGIKPTFFVLWGQSANLWATMTRKTNVWNENKSPIAFVCKGQKRPQKIHWYMLTF